MAKEYLRSLTEQKDETESKESTDTKENCVRLKAVTLLGLIRSFFLQRTGQY